MDERKLIKMLKNNGYCKINRHNSGNHVHYKRDGVERIITINGGKKTNHRIIDRIMKQIKEDNGMLIK